MVVEFCCHTLVVSHLELGSQLPFISLGQGEGVLSEDVGEDEEELHVGEFCTGANSLPRAVRQKTFLVLYHLKRGFDVGCFYTVCVSYDLALFQEMLRIEFIWVRPPPQNM